MKIRFADPAMAKCFTEEASAVMRWGKEVASRLRYILNFLACIDRAADMGRFAFLDARSIDGAPGQSWTLRVWGDWRMSIRAAEDDDHALDIMEVYCHAHE